MDLPDAFCPRMLRPSGNPPRAASLPVPKPEWLRTSHPCHGKLATEKPNRSLCSGAIVFAVLLALPRSPAFTVHPELLSLALHLQNLHLHHYVSSKLRSTSCMKICFCICICSCFGVLLETGSPLQQHSLSMGVRSPSCSDTDVYPPYHIAPPCSD